MWSFQKHRSQRTCRSLVIARLAHAIIAIALASADSGDVHHSNVSDLNFQLPEGTNGQEVVAAPRRFPAQAPTGQLPVDSSTPIYHVSPAQCHGGWMNDPNGPFELNGVHHHFYQYGPMRGGGGAGPGRRLISWGHVAGNLSHWYCLPMAIKPGVDYNGNRTPYDTQGVFTGSVTIVNGVPVASYPGEVGNHMCEATPVDLDDPYLVKWKKNSNNPLIRTQVPRSTGPLGCTGSWRDASGNWTTTIQSMQVLGEKGMKTTFWTSSNYINWTFLGTLKGCEICDSCVQSCSDFYPAPGGPDNRWIFGINTGGCHTGGGAITGTFDQASLTFTPDRPQWASDTRRYRYDYGQGLFPKNYETSDGRRVQWAWLNFGTSNTSWRGMQSLPRVITAAPDDDPTTALLINPVAEVNMLRQEKLASVRSLALNATSISLHGVQSRHIDVVVTFRGLTRALAATPRSTQKISITVLGHPGVTFAWSLVARDNAPSDAWADGDVTGAGSGPLALRRSQDTLQLRVLADGCVAEGFWDGGRVRATASARGSGGGIELSSGLSGLVADVDVWRMGSAWLSMHENDKSVPLAQQVPLTI